nr:PREDICTED: low-density lipoprotein receptor class A domain-containing protein 1 [Opisthocomus hoazin]
MNKTHPQRNGDVPAFDSAKSFSEERVLILVLALAAGLAAALGLLPRAPANRFCATANNRTGFLCNDGATCVPARRVCDGVGNCGNGEDEQDEFCGDLPRRLPGYLVFRCGNPAYWVYADQRCDGRNDCGDCSDEMGSLAACPPCGSEWWSCSPVLYEFCSCVPRRLCRDGIQHCLGWSDEYVCRP